MEKYLSANEIVGSSTLLINGVDLPKKQSKARP